HAAGLVRPLACDSSLRSAQLVVVLVALPVVVTTAVFVLPREVANALALVLERTRRRGESLPAAVLALAEPPALAATAATGGRLEGVRRAVDHHVVDEHRLRRGRAEEPARVGHELDPGDEVVAILRERRRPGVVKGAVWE